MMWMCPGSSVIMVEQEKKVFFDLREDKKYGWYSHVSDEWKLPSKHWGSPHYVWLSHLYGIKMHHYEAESFEGLKEAPFEQKKDFNMKFDTDQILLTLKTLDNKS